MQTVTISILLFILSHVLFSSSACATALDSPQIVQTTQKINLNTADESALVHAVKGIGKKRAEAIIQYREEHGQFKSLDELAYVHGLGAAFVKRNKELLKTVFELG